MPEKKTIERARQDKREGKSPSTQAGEFVRETMEHIREGKHGARSTKQAIAIGLSKARRAGVKLPPPKKGKTSEKTRRSAERAYHEGQSGHHKTNPTRSKAITKALQRPPRRREAAASQEGQDFRTDSAQCGAGQQGRTERPRAQDQSAAVAGNHRGPQARRQGGGFSRGPRPAGQAAGPQAHGDGAQRDRPQGRQDPAGPSDSRGAKRHRPQGGAHPRGPRVGRGRR